MNTRPKNNARNRVLAMAQIGILATTMGVSAAYGQSVLEEIVVTATKRGDQNLQDVPFSIQAITGDQLLSRGALDFNDYFRTVPGLAVFDQGPGDKRYIIRGVNSVGAGTVGLYLDEAIITGENAQDGGGRQADIKLFDIDRVEVLKGPQGTTFGSSSLSGTIRYITKKPDLNEFGAGISGSLRATDGADLGGVVDGFVNILLSEGKSALRISGYVQDSPGYIDNILGDGVNSDDSTAVRASLLLQPTDSFDLTLMGMVQNTESDGPAYYNLVDYTGAAISPGDNYFQADVTRNAFEDDLSVFNVTANLEVESGVFTGTASWFSRDTLFDRDSSFALEAFANLPATGAGRSIITQPKEREVQSLELRYASDLSGSVNFLGGIFYQAEERSFRSAILSASGGSIDPNPMSFLDRNVSTDIDEFAVFGEVSVDLTDRFHVIGGLRYYDFSIDEIAEAVTGFGGGAGGGFGPALSSSEDGVTFKFNAAYDVTDDAQIFLQVAEGFRAGGTNDTTAAAIANVVIPNGFESDSLINYEVGLKSRWMEDRVTANAAFYVIDWSDIQIQNQATDGNLTFPFRGNGGGATVTGLELEFYARPSDRLELGVTANFNTAELSEDNPIPSSGLKNDAIPYVPESTLSLTGEYEWPISLGGGEQRMFFGGDVNIVSSRTTELRSDNPLFIKLKGYTLVGLRAGVRGDNWDVVLSANNVTNDDTVVDVFRVIPGLYPEGFIINRPATISLRASRRF